MKNTIKSCVIIDNPEVKRDSGNKDFTDYDMGPLRIPIDVDFSEKYLKVKQIIVVFEGIE